MQPILWSSNSMSNRNALLGDILCDYLRKGPSLNYLRFFSKPRFSVKLLKAFEF